MNFDKWRFISLVLMLFLVTDYCLIAQSNKKVKGKKHTSNRERERRIQEGEARNQEKMPYSPVKKTSSSGKKYRDDLIWKAETGNTIYKKAGNISLLKYSRYGIADGLELQSQLFFNYFAPNIFIKKRWIHGDHYLSSRHGLYSATPGFNYAQENNYNEIVDSSSTIPSVIGIKNEILFSKPFSDKYSCTPNQPLWILNLGVGFDYGIPFTSGQVPEIEKHFLANRSSVLGGNGYMAYLFVGALMQLGNSSLLDVSVKYINGSFSGGHAIEQKTWFELFVLRNFSTSIGYQLSVANYSNVSTFGFAPMFDITWYFGKKQGREKGLFGKKM